MSRRPTSRSRRRVTIQVRTEPLARLLADRLRAAEFSAFVDPRTCKVQVELSGTHAGLTKLLHAIEEALAGEADGQARIRLDGRTYLLEPRGAGLL